MKKLLSFTMAGMMAVGMAASSAIASEWPNRPVTVIVGASACSGRDDHGDRTVRPFAGDRRRRSHADGHHAGHREAQ